MAVKTLHTIWVPVRRLHRTGTQRATCAAPSNGAPRHPGEPPSATRQLNMQGASAEGATPQHREHPFHPVPPLVCRHTSASLPSTNSKRGGSRVAQATPLRSTPSCSRTLLPTSRSAMSASDVLWQARAGDHPSLFFGCARAPDMVRGRNGWPDGSLLQNGAAGRPKARGTHANGNTCAEHASFCGGCSITSVALLPHDCVHVVAMHPPPTPMLRRHRPQARTSCRPPPAAPWCDLRRQ